jgi:hypothetical protein
MSDYTIAENDFVGSDSVLLFQSHTFFQMHALSSACYFELCHKGKVKAHIHFTPVDGDGAWRSPARGTFGGLGFLEDTDLNELLLFFKNVESSLRTKGANALEILPAPQAYDPVAFAKQVYLLRSCGFEIIRCDLNQSLNIDERSLSDRMSYSNRKRLRKCEREGLVAMQLTLSDLPLVYQTLFINREKNGHTLSMSLAQLQLMVDTFPEDILLFGCSHENHLAAAAYCLRLSHSVLYVFYWGDRPEYATYSPVVAVADSIYRYAQLRGFRVMDVGTSTVDIEPNLGLLKFKLGLGFEESLKVVMRKTL